MTGKRIPLFEGSKTLVRFSSCRGVPKARKISIETLAEWPDLGKLMYPEKKLF